MAGPSSTPDSHLRGVALYERDHGKYIGLCLHVLHEDGLIRAWAADEVDDMAVVPGTSKLERKQIKLREAERACHGGSVKGRQAYYAGRLTHGTALEVWSELDRAWCRCTVVLCPAYFDRATKAYTAEKKPVATVSFGGGAEGTICLDSDVWRMAGESAEVEHRMRDHWCLLVLPKVGVSVTRALASPYVTLAVQMEAGSGVPLVSVNEWTAAITQTVVDRAGKRKLKRVIVELPVAYDVSGAVDASFDDKGVLKVLYTAKKHEILS